MKRIRWGGDRLGTVLGKAIGPEADYAESWEIADHGLDQSVVADGAYAGWTLQRLVRERGEELFGRHAGLSQFPLLIKFLDAQDRLSVQVHPNDAQARTYDPAENGKTEAWVILDSAPGSVIYAGLKTGIDRADLERELGRRDVESCLHSFPARAGDCVFVPAGTVHAIGEGVLLAEVQQSSDITFRLYDWGRLGPDQKPRTIHIREALDCIDYGRGPLEPLQPVIVSAGDHTLEELVCSPYFVIRRHTSAVPFLLGSDDSFRILMLLKGAGGLIEGADEEPFHLGETVLLTAGTHVQIEPQGELTVLEVFLP